MSDFQIDNKHLKKLHGAVQHLVEHLEGENKILIDQDEDLFIRYMAYQRLVSFMDVFSSITQMATTQFRLGFDLRDDAFDTKQRKKKGWTGSTLGGNPFFTSDESDNDEDDEEEHEHGPNCKVHAINGEDLPDEVKQLLAHALRKAMKSGKK